VGNNVQTFLDVGVQLERNRCWKWIRPDEEIKENRYKLWTDPEIERWISQRNMKFRKTRLKIVHPKMNRPCWEIFYFFENIHQARYFAAAWNLKSVGPEILREHILEDLRAPRRSR
jgi:hypothetical protein